MSEFITSANLDLVIKKNLEIKDEINSIYAIEERQEKEDFDEYIKIEIVREGIKHWEAAKTASLHIFKSIFDKEYFMY